MSGRSAVAAPLTAMALAICAPSAGSGDEAKLRRQRADDGRPAGAATCPPARRRPAEPAAGTESSGLVFVPGGCYVMGSNDGDKDEKPPHPVILPSFWIGKTEVTAGAYRAFVQATNRDTPDTSGFCNYGKPDRADDPMNCVTWQEAADYCQWKYPGGRLPTEAEWELAAGGAQNRRYPWGSAPPEGRVCWKRLAGGKGTCPAASFPEGATPEGILGLAGNVWEWVGDWYADHHPAGLQRAPRGPASGQAHVLRGGSWLADDASWMRAANRIRGTPMFRGYDVGFRCARGVR